MSDTLTRFWMGPLPSRCDLTETRPDLKHGRMLDGFVDGATTLGPWACMCLSCHRKFGKGVGTGKGQQYEPVQINNITRWKKVAG